MSEQTASLRLREGDQALPVQGREAVTPRVIANLARLVAVGKCDAELAQLLTGEFEARTALGIQRYGHPLETHNGRCARRDLVEELADAAQYAQQVAMENPGDERAALTADAALHLLIHARINLLCEENDHAHTHD